MVGIVFGLGVARMQQQRQKAIFFYLVTVSCIWHDSFGVVIATARRELQMTHRYGREPSAGACLVGLCTSRVDVRGGNIFPMCPEKQ